MQFAEIPGLSDMKQSLLSSHANNHIAHAQMFSSNEGGGGLPMALAFTTFLLCENKQEKDACGVCANCHKMTRLVHPDVHFFYPKISSPKKSEYDKQVSDSLKIWRDFVSETPYGNLDDWINKVGLENKQVSISKEDSRRIIKTVSMKSFEGGFKIIIIWYPELMHPTAANGILKILEEPPNQTLYLLVSFDYERLLTTIKSRTQLFVIPPFEEQEIQQYLENKLQLTTEVANTTSKRANGSIGLAIEEANTQYELSYTDFREWMLLCLRRDYTNLVARSEDFAKKSKPLQRQELNISIDLLREALLAAVDPELVTKQNEERAFLLKFSDTVESNMLEKSYFLISDALHHLGRNASAKITYLQLSLAISELIARK
jgi:DNA polymerase-3 subunit delta'